MNTDNFIVYLILPALLVIMCLICWDSSKKSAAEIQMNEARRGYYVIMTHRLFHELKDYDCQHLNFDNWEND